ncbi:TPA: hypothetical protein OUD88_002869 [Enterobacter hormaechei]|nr:hypothetical protein [Enterobacter hormaechei]
MFTKADIEKALPMVALYKKVLHNNMLTCPVNCTDELIELRQQIEGLTKFQKRLTTELKKDESDFLKELNKQGI